MGSVFSGDDYIPMQIDRQKDLYLYHTTLEEDKIAGVIINITVGTSYDPLFTQVAQKSTPGTKVLVYHSTYQNLEQIVNEMSNSVSKKPVVPRILKQIGEIDPDCTIFNWECCSGCETTQFPNGDNNIKILKKLLDKGYMTMFSDFSLKALIKNWDQGLLGPNPFVYLSEFGGLLKLGFNKSQISECSSSQLKAVGDLSKQSNCELKALEKTIVFSIDHQKVKNQNAYTLELLTVALIQNIQAKFRCNIDTYDGAAGHVMLKYPKGGCLLASMGHWCELVKVKTSEQQLIKWALNDYGEEEACRIKNELKSMDYGGKQRFLASTANMFVQRSTPGNHQVKKYKKFM